tara:strand:+ start:4470 stop:5696 length:1227 start_codon:yes stop_codon:yes gene_type:complete
MDIGYLVKNYEKLKWLLITVLPGFYRILLISLISLFTDAESAVTISNDFTMSVVLISLSGLGFSTYIIKESSHTTDNTVFYRVLVSSIFFFLIIAVPVIIIMEFLNLIIDRYAVIVFVLSNVIYQCVKGVFFSRKNVSGLLFLEVSIYFFSVAFSYFLYSSFDNENAYLHALSLSYLISILLVCLYFNLGCKEFKYSTLAIKKDFDGVKLGVSNLMTTGLMFFLPSFSRVLGGDDYVTVMATCASIIGMVAVIPRTYINTKLPEIAKKINEKSLDIKYYSRFSNKISMFLSLFSPLSIFVIIFYNKMISKDNLDLMELSVIVTLMVSVLWLGQLSFIHSRFVIFSGKVNFTLYINILIFAIFIITYLVLLLIDFDSYYSLVILILSIFSGYTIRYLLYKVEMRKYFEV